jgi:hypothetical protein
MTDNKHLARNESPSASETAQGVVPHSNSATATATATEKTFPPAVMRLRRLQIRAVVVGVLAGIVWLVGLSLPQLWMAYLGAGIAMVAWVCILTLGMRAHFLSQRERRDG